jgi:hypothetical protein
MRFMPSGTAAMTRSASAFHPDGLPCDGRLPSTLGRPAGLQAVGGSWGAVMGNWSGTVRRRS